MITFFEIPGGHGGDMLDCYALFWIKHIVFQSGHSWLLLKNGLGAHNNVYLGCFNCRKMWQCVTIVRGTKSAHKICIVSHDWQLFSCPRLESLYSNQKDPNGLIKKNCIYFVCDASVCCPRVCLRMAAAVVTHPKDMGVFQHEEFFFLFLLIHYT